jgi:ABC-type multidrug transport system fused ATPase/permease subunit
VFDGVGVTYPGRQEPALRELDLVVPAHRVLALVGETGAGKTTVANLLLRFIEPQTGTIRVGGTDLAAIDPSTWRSSVAWVAQRPYLFHGSIADNIRLARPDATDAEVLRAASDAGATGFIAGLPAGLDTPVGEGGARLSGGQRQRVAIARAFLADAPLVILDEVTAHLDAASEVAVRDAIGRLSAGRTVVIVSHRLRLAAMADTIVVLAGGRAVETGPPTVLAARDGPYARLLAAAPGDAPGFA